MLQQISQKYSGCCMMLFKKQEGTVTFLGSSFLINEQGYLLTAAHLFTQNDTLMVVPFHNTHDFVPLTYERVAPIPVSIIEYEPERDVALLNLNMEMQIQTPDHILGNTQELIPGTSVMCMGFPFGHYQLHNLVILNSIISSKFLSKNNTKLLLFDTMVHDGARGGPLINAVTGRIIGIISGRFHPFKQEDAFLDTNLSYAVSIEYGTELIEKQDISNH